MTSAASDCWSINSFEFLDEFFIFAVKLFTWSSSRERFSSIFDNLRETDPTSNSFIFSTTAVAFRKARPLASLCLSKCLGFLRLSFQGTHSFGSWHFLVLKLL